MYSQNYAKLIINYLVGCYIYISQILFIMMWRVAIFLISFKVIFFELHYILFCISMIVCEVSSVYAVRADACELSYVRQRACALPAASQPATSSSWQQT
jgi:hypothetical protein